MKEMISCCGFNCSLCPVYIATKEDSDVKRKEAAALVSKIYKMVLSADDINCDGCRSDTGKLFGHCTNCEVRKCSAGHQADNCAYCPDYSCSKLDSFLKAFPDNYARNNLERIRVSFKS